MMAGRSVLIGCRLRNCALCLIVTQFEELLGEGKRP